MRLTADEAAEVPLGAEAQAARQLSRTRHRAEPGRVKLTDAPGRGRRRARRRARPDPRGNPGPHHHRRGRPGQRGPGGRGGQGRCHRRSRAARELGRGAGRGESDRAATLAVEAEDLVRAANDAQDQAVAQAAQADQRAASAEARAEDARAETTRAREDAAREVEQLRADTERERDEILARLTDTAKRLSDVIKAARRQPELERWSGRDAARERDELRGALESRAQVLEESRGELRGRAERAERDLDAARAELGPGRPGARYSGTPEAAHAFLARRTGHRYGTRPRDRPAPGRTAGPGSRGCIRPRRAAHPRD